ncbi:MAG: M13 family metallopeptidase, partial [Firmicutes bacterium]|nr:M13 family metallopeptidase [Bacillota bacterium]
RSEDESNVEMTYNLWTFGELCGTYDFIDLRKMAAAEGFSFNDDDVILVSDIGLAYNLAAECSKDRELAKYMSEISLEAAYAPILSTSCLRAGENFRNAIYGADGAMNFTVQERAVSTAKNYMSDYISEMYNDMYITPQDLENVNTIAESVVANYKKKIENNTWMSSATKTMALNKLNKMKIKVGFGEYEDYLADAKISEDKTLFENSLEMSKASRKWMNENIGKPVNKNTWAMPAYEANACYLPTTNEMVLPAGILKAPFYSSTASFEENMGGIGFIIAHEISHAFDNNGSIYDENGDYKNWWTEDDRRRFAEKCSDIAAMYDGVESASGIPTNGRLTVGEAIADLGGLSCVSEILRNSGNADMERFYTSYAKIWETVIPREYMELASYTDEHPANNVRVNVSLANLDDFVKTFGIQEGDGMYIPADERVGLW